MLPTSIEMVIIVIIASANLVVYMTGIIVVHRTCLIFGIKVFNNNKESFDFTFKETDDRSYLADAVHIVLYCGLGVTLIVEVLLLIYTKDLRKNLVKPCFVVTGLAVMFAVAGEILKSIFGSKIWPFSIFNTFGNVFSLLFILFLFIIAYSSMEVPNDE